MTFKNETRGRPRRKEFTNLCQSISEALKVGSPSEITVSATFSGHMSFRYGVAYAELRREFPNYKFVMYSHGKTVTICARLK